MAVPLIDLSGTFLHASEQLVCAARVRANDRDPIIQRFSRDLTIFSPPNNSP